MGESQFYFGFVGVNDMGVRKNYLMRELSRKKEFFNPKNSLYCWPQCVFVYTMTHRSWPPRLSHFCLGKSNQNRVRRTASLRCRPLPANRGKPWAAIFSPDYPIAFYTLYAKSCYALAPFTALPVFPGFFPKLFCGRGNFWIPRYVGG